MIRSSPLVPCGGEHSDRGIRFFSAVLPSFDPSDHHRTRSRPRFWAGALNIGAEGQFYAGAIAATRAGLHLNGWPAPSAIAFLLFASVGAGVLWVTVPAFLRLRFGVLEVISTLLLNFVAEALVSWMVQGPLQETKRIYPQSDPIAASARLPLIPGTRLHLGFAAGRRSRPGLWVLYRRTWWGFTLRATGAGASPRALRGGSTPDRVIATALLPRVGSAGLAGGAEVSGVSYALFQSLSPGYGFTGIAVALLARLNPLGIIASGLLFASPRRAPAVCNARPACRRSWCT